MSASTAQGGAARRLVVPLIVLSALCAVFYGFGLTDHGLTNWQESQRALVSREMFRAGEWLVPTSNGAPYIAKPPMMYWAAMVIGHARAALGFAPFVDETEIRLTVAIAGALGVLATFVVARRMLGPDDEDEAERSLAHEAAWWSALGLATGILYFRSARIGELDILTIPFIVIAVGAIDAARRFADRTRRAHWAALAIATVAGVGTALTKGPPPLLVIALAGYGPVALRSVAASAPVSGRVRAIGAALGALAMAAPSTPNVEEAPDALGVVVFGVIGALLGGWLVRAARPRALARMFVAFSRTHPLLTLGVPLLALWGWGQLVAMRIGDALVAELAAAQLEGNLRALIPTSPVRNLGFMAYGVAPISVAALAGVVWALRERPRFCATSGRWTPFVWIALAFVLFSTLGKGVARYLTPAWPGVALVGGLWLATVARERATSEGGARGLRWAAALAMVIAGAAQTWWYGAGRQDVEGYRSPREFVRELQRIAPSERVGTYEIWNPALNYYFDRPVTRWEARPRLGGRSVEDLLETLREGEVLLIARRETERIVRRFGSIQERLRAAGAVIEEVEVGAEFTRIEEDAPVVALRVRLAGVGEAGGASGGESGGAAP